MKLFNYVFYALFTALSISANATVIDTTAPLESSWYPFGEDNTATYGQTFTITGDNILNSFSLYLTAPAANPVDFRGYLYEWNGSRATGASLFTSADQQFTGSPSDTPTEFSFSTGGITLEVGKTYVAFLSASGLFDGIQSTVNMPYSGTFGTDALTGGTFVYYINGNDFSLLTTSTWDKTYGVDDVWFKASLSSSKVPEPATLALFGLGFAGIAFSRRNKA